MSKKHRQREFDKESIETGFAGMQMPEHITNSEGEKYDNALFRFFQLKAERVTGRPWSFDRHWNITDGNKTVKLSGRKPSEISQDLA